MLCSVKPHIQLNNQGIHSESATITCIDFIDEDRCIITCSEDGSIQVRKADTGEKVGESWTDEGSGGIHAMAVSPDQTEVVTGSQDGRIRLWEVATGKRTRRSRQAHSLTILSVCWSPDSDRFQIASGSEDGTAFIWDINQDDIVGHPIRTNHPHARDKAEGKVARLGKRTGPICAIVLSQDKLLLAAASLDNTISLLESKDQQALSRDANSASLLNPKTMVWALHSAVEFFIQNCCPSRWEGPGVEHGARENYLHGRQSPSLDKQESAVHPLE
ncbi:WD40-repeat-containing domain protein [Suillus fuscotomentosus]|uniref:WD40-repeat-containing domain protein n=1 Tax=Suillus fuscotomentosus TaxID=1912939 RepID=A0AAD4E5E5_9AGAM|nr:WD40-repeat-containing domain protein [Suillus fuscotomentosus]KAG1900068.1 WD40-repeat-containing domain protein [Suillus fuscotomentosus]